MADLPSTPDAAPLPPSVERQLARLSDRLYDALMLLDSQWRITYANPMAFRISQLTEADFNRKTLWEQYPGVLESPLGQAYLEAAATQTEREVQGYYYDPLKTTFDLRIFPMEGGVGVHYRDVTAVREAEHARDASSAQLQQVLDATADGVITIDRDWTVTYVNRRAIEITAANGELMGRKFWDCFPSAVYEGSPYVVHYTATMLHGTEANFEAFYPAPLDIWVDVTSRPFPDGIILFFRDVTARKKNEQELHDSEARYRLLTELSPQSQWTASPEGLVLYANQRFPGVHRQTLRPQNRHGIYRLLSTLRTKRVLSKSGQQRRHGRRLRHRSPPHSRLRRYLSLVASPRASSAR